MPMLFLTMTLSATLPPQGAATALRERGECHRAPDVGEAHNGMQGGGWDMSAVGDGFCAQHRSPPQAIAKDASALSAVSLRPCACTGLIGLCRSRCDRGHIRDESH